MAPQAAVKESADIQCGDINGKASDIICFIVSNYSKSRHFTKRYNGGCNRKCMDKACRDLISASGRRLYTQDVIQQVAQGMAELRRLRG